MKRSSWAMPVLILVLASSVWLAAPGQLSSDAAGITIERVPDGGIQPQAVVDGGVVHLIYFRGDPAGGDVYYTRTPAGRTTFAAPLRVNSQPGSVIATGTVRGAHLAIGRNGRVHVAWMGSRPAAPRAPDGSAPMLYSRLNDSGSAFEEQRNVIRKVAGLDGGGSVAADSKGNVYVAWHGGDHHAGEGKRAIWVARSADDGKTFAPETLASSEPTGACGCCGMRAFADVRGALYLLYRTATEQVNRDMFLLGSADRGVTFEGQRIHRWKRNACPMSTTSMAAAGKEVLAGWETEGQVYYATIEPHTWRISEPAAAPGSTGKRRHPAVAAGGSGSILVWTEGMAWKQGGSLAWQLFDRAGNPVGAPGEVPGVPVWSLPAVIARPNGGFTIFY